MPILEGSRSSVNILIIEDDRVTLKMLMHLLKLFGLEVDSAESGEEALELFNEKRHDLIISDYNLPGMSGLDTFEKIKVDAPQTKFVLMTIYAESDVLIRAINLGVDRFMEKPVSKDKIEKVIENLISDITNAKEVSRYQTLLSAYRLGVDASTILSMLDSEGRFVYTNEQFCEISGYSSDELKGMHYSEIRKDTGVYAVKYYENKFTGDNTIWNGYMTNIDKAGNEYITEVNLLPIRGGGEVEGFISIEKDMRFLVAKHQSHLQDTFESDISIVFAYDSNKFLRVYNSAFSEFFGFSSRDISVIEMMCAKGCIFSSGIEVRCGDDVFHTDSAREFFNTVDKLDCLRITLTVNETGKEYFFILNRFEVNQEYLGLENITVVRLHDITELELLKNEELNRAMLVSIGKLAAGITHEINTPLTYIKGNFELMQWELEGELKEETAKNIEDYFTSINDGISRISLIIESMKEVTGEATFTRENYNLYSTLVVAGRMVHNRAKHISPIYINGKQLMLDSDTEEVEFFAEISPRLLEQVWIILLNNSLDQLSQSGLTFEEKYIKIGIDKVDEWHLITIEDNGGGIDPKIQNKLFRLFSSSKKHKGMGLGLNIAKNIIDKHGGTIRPYNSKNGAVFEIVL